MNRIFGTSEQQYTKCVVLYGKLSDNYLYVDPEHTDKEELDRETLLNLCMTGLIISYEGSYYWPVSFADKTDHAEVTIATDIESSAAVTFYSKEYSG